MGHNVHTYLSPAPHFLVKKNKRNKKLNLNILYYNYQGLASEESLLDLENTLCKIKYDIIGSEWSKKEASSIHMYHGETMLYE